ncbi:MAG: DEAD/DEAH box helicase, partial [Deltaproteobacteria bacterium]|nr:DEAD/DEAH box helicase [Deltaproteobacteria bacterium]
MEKLFHPLIVKWFREYVGIPADIQEKAWPEIASGSHVLITAPTGSGKTLTAFLWAINELVTGKWERGTTRVLYVSPLKALNNDIRRNLIQPLDELKGVFTSSNKNFPGISVMTRSGDTSESDRRQMVRNPPEIMITTPESLNIILSS